MAIPCFQLHRLKILESSFLYSFVPSHLFQQQILEVQLLKYLKMSTFFIISTATTLVQATVSFCQDSCNNLFPSLPDSTTVPWFTPQLTTHQWLLIHKRKKKATLAILNYKVLHNPPIPSPLLAYSAPAVLYSQMFLKHVLPQSN